MVRDSESGVSPTSRDHTTQLPVPMGRALSSNIIWLRSEDQHFYPLIPLIYIGECACRFSGVTSPPNTIMINKERLYPAWFVDAVSTGVT